MGSDSESSSDSSSSESEERRKKERKREKKRRRDDDSGSESSDERKKKKKRKEHKKKERKEKKEKKAKEKKEKKKKHKDHKRDKERSTLAATASGSGWGKYGIIREADMHSKQARAKPSTVDRSQHSVPLCYRTACTGGVSRMAPRDKGRHVRPVRPERTQGAL